MNDALPLVAANCRYGHMLTFPYDTVIGRSLRLYGEWAEHEISLLARYLRAGAVVADVGANVGTHTLAFSALEPRCRVVAVEAQPSVAAVLEVNRQFGARDNVTTVNALMSDRAGWARIPSAMARVENVGAVTLGSAADRGMWRFWHALSPCRGTDRVPVRTLDALMAGLDVCLMKLDIEGMEAVALAGARETLRRCSPVVFIEQLDTVQLPTIFKILMQLRYRLYWLETHPFNQRNFNNVVENIWYRTEAGILALPDNMPQAGDLAPASLYDQAPPKLLDAREGWAG